MVMSVSIRWLAAVAVLALVTSVASAETVAWYRFEDGEPQKQCAGNDAVRDSGPNGLHGATPYGSRLFYIDGIAPDSEMGLNIDERGDWVFVPDHPKLQLTKSLTVEAWVKIRGYQQAGVSNFIIFRGDNTPGWDAYVLYLDPGARTLGFHVEGPGSEPGDPPATVTCRFWWVNQAVHVAGTLDHETGRLALYVNGDLMAEMTTNIRPRAPMNLAESPGLGIGGYHAGKGGSFSINGVIDEVRISNAALQPSQLLCGARPELAWVGTRGFGEDGVDPDSGKPKRTFLFAVRYLGPEAPAPEVKLHLRRDGDHYRTLDMDRARGHDEGDSSVYRASIELGADVWEYQFEASGATGSATGEPTKWHKGPQIEGPGRH